MVITLNEMNKINQVQVEILKEITRVCKALDIKYFMVHGSLLGTVRNQGFIPFDDDIDIAIPRVEYEKFLEEAPRLIGPDFFVQSVSTDKEYPLEFAKVRNNKTTYIVAHASKIKMHHGIYVDIFPIDYTPTGRFFNLKYKLLNTRIGCVYQWKKLSFKMRILRAISRIYCFSYQRAISKRDKLLRQTSINEQICITGGKPTERALPASWFASPCEAMFEGIEVWIPVEYKKYLTHIYGDYQNRTLVEGKMQGDKVEINACIVDVDKAYTEYLK